MRIAALAPYVCIGLVSLSYFANAQSPNTQLQLPIPRTPNIAVNQGTSNEDRATIARQLRCGVALPGEHGIPTIVPYFGLRLAPVLVIGQDPQNNAWIISHQGKAKSTGAANRDADVEAWLTQNGIGLYNVSSVDCFIFNIVKRHDDARNADNEAFATAITQLDASINSRIDAYANRELLARIQALEERIKILENQDR